MILYTVGVPIIPLGGNIRVLVRVKMQIKHSQQFFHYCEVFFDKYEEKYDFTSNFALKHTQTQHFGIWKISPYPQICNNWGGGNNRDPYGTINEDFTTDREFIGIPELR